MDLLPKEILEKHYFLFQPQETCFPWGSKVNLIAASLPSSPEQQLGQKSLLLLWSFPNSMKDFEWKELRYWLNQKYPPLSQFIGKNILCLPNYPASALLSHSHSYVFSFNVCASMCAYVHEYMFVWAYMNVYMCVYLHVHPYVYFPEVHSKTPQSLYFRKSANSVYRKAIVFSIFLTENLSWKSSNLRLHV